MTQLALTLPERRFDYAAGARARDEGIALTATANATFVGLMRAAAERIAREKGSVHIDDIRQRAIDMGIAPATSAAWGAVFAERRKWTIVGYRRSELESNHGHRSPVWALAQRAEQEARP